MDAQRCHPPCHLGHLCFLAGLAIPKGTKPGSILGDSSVSPRGAGTWCHPWHRVSPLGTARCPCRVLALAPLAQGVTPQGTGGVLHSRLVPGVPVSPGVQPVQCHPVRDRGGVTSSGGPTGGRGTPAQGGDSALDPGAGAATPRDIVPCALPWGSTCSSLTFTPGTPGVPSLPSMPGRPWKGGGVTRVTPQRDSNLMVGTKNCGKGKGHSRSGLVPRQGTGATSCTHILPLGADVTLGSPDATATLEQEGTSVSVLLVQGDRDVPPGHPGQSPFQWEWCQAGEKGTPALEVSPTCSPLSPASPGGPLGPSLPWRREENKD